MLALLAARPAAAGPPCSDPASLRRERRARVAREIGEGYALLLGQPFTDVLQPRQEGHFLYLTGVEDPGASLLMCGAAAAPLDLPGPGGKRTAREILWLRGGKPRFVRFYGLRRLPGPESARRLGVEAALPAPKNGTALAGTVARLLPKGAHLHLPAYRGGDLATVREIRTAFAQELGRLRPDVKLEGLDPLLRKMRAVKDAYELERIERAVALSLEAFRQALPEIRPGSTEQAVDAALLAAIRRAGGRPAYPFIVAAGAHSTIPHYFRNQGPLRTGDLLVIDAAAEVEHYAADVTRTFPVSGHFTPRQREVYLLVLRAQRAAIAAVRPGATLAQVHAAARKVIAAAGLGDAFLHGTSHHVGLDVHDPGVSRLAPGMTITVEPGVYLPQEGFGARVEDVVLVTRDGRRVLSAAFPKDPDRIERLLAQAR